MIATGAAPTLEDLRLEYAREFGGFISLCRKSFLVFLGYMLGEVPEPMHREWVEIIESHPYSVILAPRGHLYCYL